MNINTLFLHADVDRQKDNIKDVWYTLHSTNFYTHAQGLASYNFQ